MLSIDTIEDQLKNNRNWVLVPEKQNVLQCLQGCMVSNESIVDIIDGLFNGVRLKRDPGHAGILCVTSRRLLFIGTEAGGLYEEIAFSDIRSLQYSKEPSAWKLEIETAGGEIDFSAFTTRIAIEIFRDLIMEKTHLKKGGTEDTPEEKDEKERMAKPGKAPQPKKARAVRGAKKKKEKKSDDTPSTVKKSQKKDDDPQSEKGNAKKLPPDEKDTPRPAEEAGPVISGPINRNFLFLEAKKIGRTISKYIYQSGSIELKELVVNDLLLLSSLCSQVDNKTTDEEKIFIAMVFLPLNLSDTRTMDIESAEFYSRNVFPIDYSPRLITYFDGISRFITGSHVPVNNAIFLSLPYLKYYDEHHGTNHYNVMVSIFNTYANCLLKADGTVSGAEKELLKGLAEIIQRSGREGSRKREIYRLDPPPRHNRSAKGKGISSGDNKISGKKDAGNKGEDKEVPGEYIADDFNESETLEDVLKEINALVGMDNIKKEISTFINVIKVYKERDKLNMQAPPLSLHAVFYGPPGTGKTTIARLLGRVYRCLGLLEKGHLIETDRVGLIAGYVGQTAIKAEEVIQKALDGVLFIDEAYSLSPAGELSGKDFGQEAIGLILKRMEDYRDRLVIIVAGYPDEMKRFINSNPGLQSRFSRYFYFDHYSPDVLLKIYDRFCSDVDFATEEPARKKLLALLREIHKKRSRTFGNGRVVRNIFEKAVEKQANRIADIAPLTREILRTITKDDIPSRDEITLYM